MIDTTHLRSFRGIRPLPKSGHSFILSGWYEPRSRAEYCVSYFRNNLMGLTHDSIGCVHSDGVDTFVIVALPCGRSVLDSGTLKPAAELAAKRSSSFADESTEYANARQSLLASEIEARRVLTELAEQRAALPPGPVMEADWRFCDSQGAELGLIDLFGDHDTLITYFWMYGPERETPCPMCTDTLSGLNGVAHNVRKRAAFKVLGRSPVSRQLEIARERSWKHLEFVQTVGNDYANDLGLLLDDGGEAPAFTV